MLEVVLPQLDLKNHGLSQESARVELHRFFHEIGSVEIICDAPAWDWPLLIWLAGPGGLPETVLAGRIDSDISQIEAEAPHHALLDARLLADILEGESETRPCQGVGDVC